MWNSAGPAWRERALRRKIRGSLVCWSRLALAAEGQAPALHHVAVMRELENLAAGRTMRLMLLMPPGSAKSTYASKLFPAWWMARNPAGSVIAASHTASLAAHFGRGVRSLLTEHGPKLNVFLRSDARAAAQFMTEAGGEYFSIGIHGAVTGRRADLAIIDDPVASFDDAASAACREQLWNWYRSELVTRMKPGGRIVLAMTRWHSDDLAGRLMEQDGWTILRLPALAEDSDPLGRAAGDALWPQWEDRDELLAKRDILGERHFAAMFQQAPMPDGGSLFNVSLIKAVDIAPVGRTVRAWDLAGSIDDTRDPDWTVGLKLSRAEHGGFTVEDVRRVRVTPADLGAFIVDVAHRDGPDVTVALPRDPGQAGLHQVSTLAGMLAGYKVVSGAEIGSKAARADAPSSQVNNGNFRMRRGEWNRAFTEELAAFPNGRKDDQVDALSRAFGILAPSATAARYLSMPFFER